MKRGNQHAAVIKGLLATMIGFILIAATYGMILRLFFFILGIALLNRGLRLLNIQALEDLTKALKKGWGSMWS